MEAATQLSNMVTTPLVWPLAVIAAMTIAALVFTQPTTRR